MRMTDDEIRSKFITSQGDLYLTVERINKILAETSEERINEYQLLNILTNSEGGIEQLMKQMRTLLTIKVFSFINDLQGAMAGAIDNMRPGDVSRTYTSMISAFAQMTANASKDTFDMELELQKVATELGLSAEEVKSEFKKDIANTKAPV